VQDEPSAPRALSLRFEVPRFELERFKTAVAQSGENFEARARAGRFDETHLRGRVHFEVGVPFAADPLLEFLKTKRGLAAFPPVRVALDQPVAYLIGQLAGAAVLALHGEGEFSIPLTGGKGVVSVASHGEVLDLGLPLDQYAGIAPLPAPEAAGAIAAAARALRELLESPTTRPWSLLQALHRDEAILDRLARGAAGATRDGGDDVAGPAWRVDEWVDGRGIDLHGAAAEAERAGARVVPFWRTRRLEGMPVVEFAPVRVPTRRERRGTLALCIFPGEVRAVQVGIGGDEEGTRKLRERLKRPTPFSARLSGGSLAGLEEPDRALPMA
jgi:hypothetical protein